MAEAQTIRYNLRDRGRQHTGQPRDYDIPAIVRAINCDSTQERVGLRGMVGYYGHWPRLAFGITGAEGGLDSGKAVHIEPAVCTAHLRAFDDGTIEHRTEFLDTATGAIAARLHASRIGGFSSAIDPRGPAFHGFDYVNDPNYSANRPYALDSATWGEQSLEDIIAAEQAEQQRALLRLLEIKEANEQVMLDAARRLEIEVDDLTARIEKLQRERDAGLLLVDSARVATAEMERDIAAFRAAKLPPLKDPLTRGRAMPPDPLISTIEQHFLRGR
jgi:hypothetical protein